VAAESVDYMGERGPSTTRAKTSTSTWAAFALSSARAQGIHCRTRGQNVVDQHDAPPCHLALAASGYLKCALHIAGPLGARQSDLPFGGAHATKYLGDAACRAMARASSPDWL
jgi:hypothetical protein